MSRLLGSNGHHVHLLVASDSDFCDFMWKVGQSTHDTVTVRVVRGTKCTRVANLFDEFAAALQFPYYFGENWSALSECLSDLEWVPSGNVVIAINRASDLLADASPEDFKSLFSVFATVSAEWASADQIDGIAPRTLHIVLQAVNQSDQQEIESRLRDADVEVDILR